jgi:hypothetical protein
VKVYVSGPIKGKPDGNRAAFLGSAVWLEGRGHEVCNPHDVRPGHEGRCRFGTPEEGVEHSYECFMEWDLRALLDCDAIFMMDGWVHSTGARAELDVARTIGLQVMFQPVLS